MKLRRKIFLAMTLVIVSLCVLFGLMTWLVVHESVKAAVESTGGGKAEALATKLVQFYDHNNGSWEGVRRLGGDGRSVTAGRQASFLLMSRQGQPLLREGDAEDPVIQRLGMEKTLQWNGERIAVLYYYDPEVAMLSKLRIGIPVSVLFLLIPGAMLLTAASLGAAWWLSKRLTAPLRVLLPVIGQLGKGEFGVRAPVAAQDEFGQVARALNGMSGLLQNAEAHRRNLVADVAHELRTPITILRGKLDLVQQSGGPVEPESLLAAAGRAHTPHPPGR
ncbi:HAMP domain-containing protein [Paenibacillus sp. P26]|nr:HAMP domain-containing protein [Paenibacillus sp. P26]